MSYTDDLILNSIKKSREGIEGEPDALMKAMNKTGLVQKEVQVQGKNGQTFTRKQWVKASEDQPVGNQTKTQSNDSEKSDRATLERKLESVKSSIKMYEKSKKDAKGASSTWYNSKLLELNNQRKEIEKQLKTLPQSQEQPKSDSKSNSANDTSQSEQSNSSSIDFGNGDKQSLVSLLQSGKSREDIMAAAEKQGITWKKNDHAGINWMRCSMAIQKHFENNDNSESNSKDNATSKTNESQDITTKGSKTKTKDDKSVEVSSKNNDTKAKSENKENKSYENGHIDKDGDLVVNDKSDLADLVSEVTGTDMFEQKDLALEELKKNHSITKGVIESMGVESASLNKDGSIHVTAYVEGYDDSDGDTFDKYIGFDIPVKSKGTQNSSSVIGSDYTQLTTDDEAGTPEGEAHNMIVGRLKNMGIKLPTKLDVQQAANDFRDKSIKTIISSYNADTISRNLALANVFGSISNASKLTVERVLKDTLEHGSGATREQQCNAISKLCGDGSEYEYESFGDNVAVRASDGSGKPISVTIEPTTKGLFKVEFTYGDGAQGHETYDSITAVKQATEKWIKKEEEYKQ